MSIECVILDADNTLYSTKKASTLAYLALFSYIAEKTGVAADILQDTFSKTVKTIKDSPNPQMRKKEYSLQLTLQKHAIPPAGILVEALEHFWEVVVKNLVPTPDVVSVVDYLHSKYTLVIASDEFQKSLIPKLQRVVGSLDKFSMIITPEVTGAMKPSPSYYQQVFDDLYLHPPQCMVIGDRWTFDLEPAKQLGAHTTLFNKEKAGEPDFWIKDFTELLRIL